MNLAPMWMFPTQDRTTCVQIFSSNVKLEDQESRSADVKSLENAAYLAYMFTYGIWATEARRPAPVPIAK